MKSGERSVLCCSVVKEKESFLYKGEGEKKYLFEGGIKEQGLRYPLSEVRGSSSKEEQDIRWFGGSSCPMARDLVPVLTDDDYDSIARDLLKKYYSEALKKPCYVDGEIFARRMGLSIRKVKLDPSTDIMGLFFFRKGKAIIVDRDDKEKITPVCPDTILINLCNCKTSEQINHTIFHECSHSYLHRLFYLHESIQMDMMDENHRSQRDKRKIELAARMEQQAERLSLHIIMERDNTIDVIEKEISKSNGIQDLTVMRKAMRRIMELYHVTEDMAKERMKQLGYRNVEGLCNQVEGQYISGHRCNCPWSSNNLSFTVTPSEIELLSTDVNFIREIQNNQYEYVEGHMCLSSSKYIKKSHFCRCLTDFARTHIEQCCMGFYGDEKEVFEVYAPGIAARKKRIDKNKCSPTIRLVSVPGTPESVQECRQYGEGDRFWAGIMKGMPNEFRPAIKFVMQEIEVTQEELSARLGIGRSYVARLLRSNMSTPHLVGICIALELRFDVSMRLFELSGKRLIYQDPDNHYITLLLNPTSFTVERCDEYLISNNCKPLFPNAKGRV